MHPMLNIAVQAARQASKTLLRYIDRLDSLEVNIKARNDLVTEVDRQSEQEIIQVIRRAYPNHAILGEETGFTESKDGNDFCWVIDPLDGTTNYLHGIPHFAISIAVKSSENIEVGVIYDPIRNELFSAARGKGSHLNDRRMRISPNKKLENTIIGTGFPPSAHSDDEAKPYLKIFETIFPKVGGIRRAGAAALDLAYVAAGRFDGFWEASLKEWDMAAGVLLVQEAGGMMGDFRGEKNYLHNGNIIAGNPKVYKELLELIKPVYT